MKKHKPIVVHEYITADAIHASTRNKERKVKSGISLQCARSKLVQVCYNEAEHWFLLEFMPCPIKVAHSACKDERSRSHD